jgi:hypothetical protein
MVPTMVEETRTVMKPVQKTETYTAYRTETVTEKKIVPVTTYKTETYTEMCTKTVCEKVPVVEEKVVMEKRKKIEWVTEYKQKCHVSFTKECKTIGCGDKCDDGCHGDKCGKGCFSLSIPVYKPHFETKTVACTVPKCTYECVPVTKKCCTYKTEKKVIQVPVCKTRCVPVTENKEVCCTKQVCVPYQATRCVTVCEPCTEKVQVCKMVPTWVEEQVAVAPAPCGQAPCGPAANPCQDANVCNKGDVCGNDGCGDKCCGGCFSICDKFKDCCSKVKDCGSGCCDKFKDCCSKIKDCGAGFCGKIKSCFCCK